MKINFTTILGIILVIITTMSSCNVGKRSTITQVETESYLHFTTIDENLAEESWFLKVDQGDMIKVKVDIETGRFSDDTKYSISTGNHEIFIFKGKNLYLKKKVFIGNQETKIIKL